MMYVAKFEEAIYVLHCFQKKTKATAKHDKNVAEARYRSVVRERSTQKDGVMTSHDHNFKNMLMDFPKEALDWLLPDVSKGLGPIQQISFVREEPKKRQITDAHLSLDMPILYTFKKKRVLLWLVEKLFDYKARDYYDHPNPVVKILLPKMDYEPEERTEVIRQAYRGLFELVTPMLFDKSKS